MRLTTRGLGLLTLPAVVLVAAARCTSDDTNACDACVDVAPAPLTVAVAPSEIWAHGGDSPTVTVSLARGPGGSGDATVTVVTDAGPSADPLTIPAASTTGTLTLHIPASLPQGELSLTVGAATSTAQAQASLLVHVEGAPGTPDTSFGKGGTADLTPSSGNDAAAAMLVLQSTILVGGTHVELVDGGSVPTMKVLLLASNGSIDTGDFAVTSAPGELHALARLPDGRVFAVGDVRTPKADFAAVRILAAGGLDPTYAVTTALTSSDDIAFGGVVQPGGQLVVAGTAGGSAFALARYTQSPPPPPPVDASADGASDAAMGDASEAEASPVTSVLDPTFGEGGVVQAAFSQPNAGATALLIGPDGSLYALGYARGTTTDLAALRYTPSGQADSTFGDGGVSSVAASATANVTSALLDPTGDIVAVTTDGNVMRWLPTGALDTTFGGSGIVAASTVPGSSASAVARDPASGNLYVGGSQTSTSGTSCFIARVTPTGTIDATFDVTGTSCSVTALGVDDSGLLDALETLTSTSGATHMVVSRYWP